MYLFTKHLHLTAVVISIVLFIIRYIWLLRGSPMLHKKWVKILPHVVDTVLLASAFALCYILALNPLQHDWLWQKIIAVVLYIFLGFWVLKKAQTPAARWSGFLLALGCLIIAAKLVVTKQGLIGF